MAYSSRDPIVVCYKNSVLRASDVALLDEPNWVNDNIISFWFEYLENSAYRGYSYMFAFIAPQVVQFLKFSDSATIRSTVDDLRLTRKRYIFFPLNDHNDLGAPGGTHWSLLVYNRDKNTFQHYDSLQHSNKYVACTVARKIGPYLCDHVNPIVTEMECTQQRNSYDCGIHVMCNTKELCEKYVSHDSRPLTQIVPQTVSHSRSVIKSLIYTLPRR